MKAGARKSDLRGASPKTAAKAPISLDAILVCKKRVDVTNGPLLDSPLVEPVVENTRRLAARLEAAGMSVSDGDRFVIGASQALIAVARDDLAFDAMAQRLQEMRAALLKLDGARADVQAEAEPREVAALFP
jgi:putative DNA methylase